MDTANHVWVQWQYMPVEVELLPDGAIGIKYNDDDEQLAQDQAKHGCFLCEVELTPRSVGTECALVPAG